MSEYQVLARKYRPSRFCDVTHHEAIVATLLNGIRLGRTAHAYLFCGTRGTGKTTLARLFAKALNCKSLSKEGEPCNICPSCKEIAAGHSLDVLEIDGASHRGIEDIRQINETIGFTPSSGKYKIYLIDEVHMLTKEAFNALLKTLEEPPSHAKFFFATTEPHKIPSTILSRCQRFNLGRIPLEKICKKLREIAKDLQITVEEEALLTLASLSEGSLRDAESLFDQVIAFQKSPITTTIVEEALALPAPDLLFDLDRAGSKKELTAAFQIADAVFSAGKNIGFFLEELTHHYRTLFLLKNEAPLLSRNQKRYQESALLYRKEQLLEILELLTEAAQNMKFAISEKTALEMLLLKILRTFNQVSLDELVSRLIALEGRLNEPVSAKIEAPRQVTEPAPVQIKQEAPRHVSEPALAKKEIPRQEMSAKKVEQAPKSEVLSVKEQSRHDTLIRFAAKELNGAFKKE